MSKRRIGIGPSDDRHGDKTVASDAAVEELLARAEPRPAPPRAVEVEIRSAVHAEWDQLTRARVRRRRLTSIGVAASLVIATFASLTVLRSPGSDPYFDTVATIDKQFGTVRVTGPASGDDVVTTGQTLDTGAGGGLALAWSRGGSLRVGADSRVFFESRTRVRLLEGRLYYDSVSDALSGIVRPAGSTRLLVETPHGTLRHLGTQFAAELRDEELHVFVREGAVRVESDDVRETAAAGQRMRVVTGQAVEFTAVDGAGDYWQWVEDLTPRVELDGRSIHEALRWISRETGMEVRFTSRAAEENAKQDTVSWPEEFGDPEPSKALGRILSISRFDYSVENGVIVIREFDDGDQGI